MYATYFCDIHLVRFVLLFNYYSIKFGVVVYVSYFYITSKSHILNTFKMSAPKHIKKRVANLLLLVDKNNQRISMALCTKEVSALKEKYSTNTVHAYLTYYVNEFKTSNVDAKVIDRLRLGGNLEKGRNARTKKARTKKLSNLKPINNYGGMIEQAKELLKSDHYKDIVTGLCFLTGRRSAEIMKTAEFTRIGLNPNLIMFKGQLKKKPTEQGGSFQIFALGNSAAKCCAALKRLRKKLKTKNLSNREVERKYQSVIKSACAKNFYPYIGISSPHNLRACYAVICSKLYRPEYILDNIFIASILGHNSEDIDTANSYKKYYVKQ